MPPYEPSPESLKAFAASLYSVDCDGSTALHTAVKKHNYDFANFLVGAQIDTQVQDKYGHTALYYAAKGENTQMMMMLIGTRADGRISDEARDYIEGHGIAKYGRSLVQGPPFPWNKMENGLEDSENVLINDNPKETLKNTPNAGEGSSTVDVDTRNDDTTFSIADSIKFTVDPSVKAVEQLPHVGTESTTVTADGRTPLHLASEAGQTNVVESLLISHSSILDARDNKGMTALQLAATKGHTDIVKLLLKAGAVTTAKDKDPSPLRLASDRGHSEVVRLLLQAGANLEATKVIPGSTFRPKDPPFHSAAAKGHLNVVQAFLEEGVDPMLLGYNDNTPLHSAAKAGQVHVIEALLRVKVDIMSKGQTGNTALHLASINYQLKAVKTLIKAHPGKEHVDCPNLFSRTPLQEAVMSDYYKRLPCPERQKRRRFVVAELINSKADSSLRTSCGSTVLMLATGNSCDPDVLKLLLDVNPLSLTETNKNGQTVLQIAVRRRDPENIQFFLDAGADINTKDKKGQTLLHHAMPFCKGFDVPMGQDYCEDRRRDAKLPEIVKMLLKANVVVSAQDNQGLTPLQVATKMGVEELVKLLLREVAKKQAQVLLREEKARETELRKEKVRQTELRENELKQAGSKDGLEARKPYKRRQPNSFSEPPLNKRLRQLVDS